MFLGVVGVLFLSAFISFRCGYGQGLKDAPRHHYSVDVSNALRTNPLFRVHVDSLFRESYRVAIDSILRKDEVVGMIGKWLDAHPGCQMKKESPLPITAGEAERVFFKPVNRK